MLCAATKTDEAETHRLAGRYRQAIPLYRAAVSENPKDAAAWEGLVRALFGDEKDAEALRAADEAMKQAPQTAEVQSSLGLANFRRGQLPEAEAAFRSALKLRPDYPSAVQGMASVFSCLSRFRTARQLAVRAAQQRPDDPESIVTLGDIPSFGAKHVEHLKKALALLDPASRPALRLRTHIIADEAAGDRRMQTAESKYRKYEMKLEPLGGDFRLGLRVRFNDKHTALLLLDTGVSGVMLARDVAKKAGLDQLTTEATELSGIGDGKPLETHRALAKRMTAGDLEFSNIPVTTFASSLAFTEDGIIGTDVFEQFLITLDMPQRRLTLEPFPGLTEAPDRDRLHDASSQLPSGFYRFFRFGHLLLIPTSVNEQAHRLFLIDTGATMNFIDAAVANKSTKVETAGRMAVTGGSGRVNHVYRTERIRLNFANVYQDNQGLWSFDLTRTCDGARVALSGVIGMPTLAQLRITLDYRDGAVRFEPRKR